MTPDWHRNHECLLCGHEWNAPVKFSQHTTNLSGEETAWCPRCNSRSVVSSPAYDLNTYNGTF